MCSFDFVFIACQFDGNYGKFNEVSLRRHLIPATGTSLGINGPTFGNKGSVIGMKANTIGMDDFVFGMARQRIGKEIPVF